MANARHLSNSREAPLAPEERPTLGDAVRWGEVMERDSTAKYSPGVRPPSPDRDIELAVGGDYTPKDERTYGTTDLIGTI